MSYHDAYVEALVAAVDDLASGLQPFETIEHRFGTQAAGVEIRQLGTALDTLPPRINWAATAELLPFYVAAAALLRDHGYETWTGPIPGSPLIGLVALKQKEAA